MEILRSEMYVTKDPIADSDELIADLGLDSANIAIGLVAIEDKMRIVLSHRDIVDCVTFGALLDVIANRFSGVAPKS